MCRPCAERGGAFVSAWPRDIRRWCVGFGGGALGVPSPKPAGAKAPAKYYLLTASLPYCSSFRTCCGSWFACATIA